MMRKSIITAFITITIATILFSVQHDIFTSNHVIIVDPERSWFSNAYCDDNNTVYECNITVSNISSIPKKYSIYALLFGEYIFGFVSQPVLRGDIEGEYEFIIQPHETETLVIEFKSLRRRTDMLKINRELPYIMIREL